MSRDKRPNSMLANALERLRAKNRSVEQKDEKLNEELQEKRSSIQPDEFLESIRTEELSAEGPGPEVSDMQAETIVMRTGRPVLAVLNDEPKLEFRDAESEVWRSRLLAVKNQLVHAIRAVGRIEVENHTRLQWVGTGWLVAPTTVVTNRHVAKEFAIRRDSAFVFRSGLNGTMTASVDFLEEFGRVESLTFKLKKILHIEDDGGADMAFLEVEPSSNSAKLAEPIRLSGRSAEADQFVATIGYPAKDSRIPDFDLMMDIFGDVFDKKRLAPGQIQSTTETRVLHDCSTLGGNSGSVVLDLQSGEAVALHFAGRFLESNFAVPAAVVQARLAQLRTGGISMGDRTSRAPEATTNRADQQAEQSRGVAANAGTSGASLTCTIPITLTIQVGTPTPAGTTAHVQASAGAPAWTTRRTGAGDRDEVFDTEAPPESYANRNGFQKDFLGNGKRVEMPKVRRGASQIVTFQVDGRQQSELKYQNFSVVMNRKRRMCFFSACNIDGKLSKSTVRPGWRFDSRIPQNLQIKGECYGDPPKFSRGHMTRREDPAWGNRTQANLGNADSMHVTNAVPQMQTFNGGIWLSLEDHALQNAREDDMKITVITGPFLDDRTDPVHFNVQVPVSFWKVIAFTHDQTGKLTATGYSISQEEHLPEEEFVFGEFGTFQRSIRSIESEAGISFGNLADFDPFQGEDEEESIPAPLTGLGQIRFVK